MKITGNEPANPIVNSDGFQSYAENLNSGKPECIGLTVRQQFAMAANPDLDFSLSSVEIILGKKMPPQATIMDSIAFWAEFKAHMKVIEADALIAELNRTEAGHV